MFKRLLFVGLLAEFTKVRQEAERQIQARLSARAAGASD